MMDNRPTRSYERSHPWLSFGIDLTLAPARLWMLLGEASSKLEHLGGVPIEPDTADELYKIFLAKGVRGTTAIEGNTLSEEQVREAVDGTLNLPASQEYLGQEVDNIIEAVNRVAKDLLAGGQPPLSPETVREFNRLVLKGLTLEDGVVAGEIRKHSVHVGPYLAAPAGDCEYLLERLTDWLNSDQFEAPDDHPDQRLAYAIIKAVIAHLYVAWIHPFGDGNGRTSRLIEFQILVASGVPFPAAHLLSNHYNQTRAEYYRQLDRSSKSGGDIVPFVGYAVQGLVDGLRDQILLIRDQQMKVAWKNYVYDSFDGAKGATAERQCALVLDMSSQSAPVSKQAMRVLTPRLATLYAGKQLKTLTRDLNVLEKKGLVQRVPDGYRALTEVVLAFLPPVVMTEDTP